MLSNYLHVLAGVACFVGIASCLISAIGSFGCIINAIEDKEAKYLLIAIALMAFVLVAAPVCVMGAGWALEGQ